MAGNPQVLGLLEEMLDSGKTPEEVCRDCPDLLPEVRGRWQDFRRIDAAVMALFPELGTAADANPGRPGPPTASLPQVPGYEVEAILGHGGMGVVYKARHLALKRTVALKMLAGYPHPAERARFRAEAEAVARLQHPNIVQIYEIGEVDGRPFIALEYVAGGTLAKQLAEQLLPPRDAARLVATLAEAMHLAHSRNLVHRDLKPGNVLLVGEADTEVGQCQPKVTDFGLVRQLDADSGQTFDGVVMGTPCYMAPEQAEGRAHAAGPAADTYALGAILYECLTGRPPFEGATAAETLEQVRTREPVAPSVLNRRTPRDLETICLKCLRKEPECRYASAREFADDLCRFLRDEPVVARPVGAALRLHKWLLRHRAAAGLIAAAVLLVLVGGIAAGLQYQRWAAAQDHQAKTDRNVRALLEQAREPLKEAWRAQDPVQLTAAVAEGNRAVDIARSGGGSAAAEQDAEAFQADAAQRLTRAKKNRALREAVLDVASPREIRPNEVGIRMALSLLSVDEQYVAAFRRWGLEIEGTEEAEVVRRLRAEPEVVVQELIAALDGWMMDRRRRQPQAEWRRLFRIASQLDRNDRRRQLRALLVDGLPPRAEWIAGQVGIGSPYASLWEQVCGNTWKHLLAVRSEIEPRKEPALTIVMLAQAFAAVGDTAAAEKMLRQAAAAQPGEVVLLDALGKLLESLGTSRLEEAIGYYRTARGQRSHLGLSLSSALMTARRPAQAEEVMQELLLLQPDNAAFHFFLGLAAYYQNNYGEAERAYRKAIALEPTLLNAYCNLAGALNAQHKHTEAEEVLRQAIEREPGLTLAYTNLGSALNGRKKYREAEAVLRRVIRATPGSAEAYALLGGALDGQRRQAEAEKAYRKAIALKPDFAAAYNNLGTSLAANGKGREAETALRQALDLDPAFAIAHYNLGNAFFFRQSYAEAEKEYRSAISLDLDPDHLGRAYFGLGMALRGQAHFDTAAAALKKAGDLFPVLSFERGKARQHEQLCQRYVALDARLPAILQETEKLHSAAEQIEFANLCRRKQLYVASLRFAAAAFALDPKLTDAAKENRYNAACAAALAGYAAGKDAEKLDAQERARFRRQALDWLREDLAYWTKNPKRSAAPDGGSVSQWLHHWQIDPDFAGVRDKDGLARLSSAERAQWEQFWSDVDALLQQVSKLK
jgi:serine/threonine-protein kinase